MKKTVEEHNQSLRKVFILSADRDKKIGDYSKGITENGPERLVLDKFLKSVGVRCSDKARTAAVSRLAGLRESPLIEHLKKENFSNNKIEEIMKKSYLWVAKIYKDSFMDFTYEIEKQNLLIPFYTEIIVGGRRVGELMNALHVVWDNKIKATNKELKARWGDKEDVIENLRKRNLLDLGHGGLEADRCYSVLKTERGRNVRKSYIDAFPGQIRDILTELQRMISLLRFLEDYIYNQKKEWIDYLKALIVAFSESNVDKTVLVWADAERAWMKIITPIQIGHPLEFYEDTYRKAVAPEWNMILVDLDAKKSIRHELTETMFKKFFTQFGKEKYSEIYDDSLNNLRKSQLYNGTQILYYGSLLNGIAMAQVVPNDTVVSSECGKKVFIYPADLLRKARSESIKVFPEKMFEESFIDEQRVVLYNDSESYFTSNDRDTTGHEHGHSLFVTQDTEILMNATGNFKNVEEFKATVGGMMTFFYENASENDKRSWMREIVKRAVGLMRRREDPDVVAYYSEGLIHLTALIETKVISFDGDKISVDMSLEKYVVLKDWYIKAYTELAKLYLAKSDSTLFLEKFATPNNDTFDAKNEQVLELSLWVYDFYKQYGSVIDKSVTKEDYIIK